MAMIPPPYVVRTFLFSRCNCLWVILGRGRAEEETGKGTICGGGGERGVAPSGVRRGKGLRINVQTWCFVKPKTWETVESWSSKPQINLYHTAGPGGR